MAVKVKTSHNHRNVTVLDDCESTPGDSSQKILTKEKLIKGALFELDVDDTYKKAMAPEFAMVDKTVDIDGGVIRMFEFVGK